jgi:hypothetical protein
VKPKRLAAMLRELSAVHAPQGFEKPGASAELTDGRGI